MWGAMKVFSVPSLCGALLAYFGTAPSPLIPFPSTPVPLSSYFNNQAASIDGTTGNFDGKGSTYVAEYLPTGPWVLNGVTVNPFDSLRHSRGLNLYLSVRSADLVGRRRR